MLTEALVAFTLLGGPSLPPERLLATPDQAAPARTTPMTVEEAVKEALDRNPELRGERQRLPAADARRVTAGLRPNPVFSLSTDHLDLVGTRFTESNGGGPVEISARADFDWEQGGKRARRIAVAGQEHAVTRLDIADRTRRLIFEVQDAFLELLVAQETLTLARENVAGLRRVADISAARVKAGDLSEVELMRTRVALLQLENDAREAALSRRVAQNRLQLLVGRTETVSLPVEAVGGFRRDDRPLPSQDDLVRAALEGRPDLQAVVADEARSRAEVLLQQAIGRVDYTVGAEYRRQQGVNGKSNSLGFFISTPVPLFARNQGEVARARAEANQAGLRVEAARASVAGEVREACAQHEAAMDLLGRIEREMLGDARAVRTITGYAYERGEASLVELLDAERAYNETMESYANAQAAHARSLYMLESVSGKGDLR